MDDSTEGRLAAAETFAKRLREEGLEARADLVEWLLSIARSGMEDRKALVSRAVYFDVSEEGDAAWWAIEGEGHSRLFADADAALAAYRAVENPSPEGQ